MSFERFDRPNPGPGFRASTPTIGVDKNGFITISTAAHRMLGEPSAVIVEWDKQMNTIRLTAAEANDAHAFGTGGKSPYKRFLAKAFLAYAGLRIPDESKRFLARQWDGGGIVADLSALATPTT